MIRFLTVATLATSLAGTAAAHPFSPTQTLAEQAAKRQQQIHSAKVVLKQHILSNRKETWRWETKAGHHRTRATRIGWGYSTQLMRKIVRLWHHRAIRSHQHYLRYHTYRPPATPRYTSGGTIWDSLVNCEASGNWGANTGNGFYGGLQFKQSTWSSNGGAGNPAYASREQQIAVAQRVLASQGWGAWPTCSSKLGLR